MLIFHIVQIYIAYINIPKRNNVELNIENGEGDIYKN